MRVSPRVFDEYRDMLAQSHGLYFMLIAEVGKRCCHEGKLNELCPSYVYNAIDFLRNLLFNEILHLSLVFVKIVYSQICYPIVG